MDQSMSDFAFNQLAFSPSEQLFAEIEYLTACNPTSPSGSVIEEISSSDSENSSSNPSSAHTSPQPNSPPLLSSLNPFLSATPIPVLPAENMDEKKRGKQAKKSDKPQKRRRYGDTADANYPIGNTAVSLTRDQLLSFSSEDFEAFIAKVTSQRPLTAIEEKEVKRQRRLIKNRESAHASRQRRREYMEELEAQINELKDERDSLRADNCRLREQNAQLREQVAMLEKQVQQQSTLRDLWHSMTSLRKTTLASSAGAKAAGVCLLIVLFSFGLFLNTTGGGLPSPGRLSPLLPQYPKTEAQPRLVEEPAHSLARAAGGAIVDSMSWAGHKRKLLSFPSNSSPSVDNDAGYGPSLAHPPAADGQTPLPTWKNSNITYLMCSEAEQLVASAPPESGAYPGGESYVVLLLPDKGADASEATSLTCRLVDIRRVRVERDDIHEPMVM